MLRTHGTADLMAEAGPNTLGWEVEETLPVRV